MTTVGQIEKRTQARVVALFRDRLGYDYLGDKTDLDNHNLELTLLRVWLTKQGVSDTLVNRALHELNKVATDTSKSLYPAGVKTAAQRALYNNLGKDEGLALAVDVAIMGSLQNG